ncbi:hypothetical protein M6B38_248585 [Iris pallida]|uniref:Uncharacterized protein n=1 Tax=Iris pallida TaxID=29817 RepID=A0AAX6DFL1_IRIPA|nr:hypothetical protein M6B38_248585 [Iris pallida]
MVVPSSSSTVVPKNSPTGHGRRRRWQPSKSVGLELERNRRLLRSSTKLAVMLGGRSGIPTRQRRRPGERKEERDCRENECSADCDVSVYWEPCCTYIIK